jgi:hypothetical protein
MLKEEEFIEKMINALKKKKEEGELVISKDESTIIVYLKKLPQAYGFAYGSSKQDEDEAIEDLATTLYSAYKGLYETSDILAESAKEDLKFISELVS